MTRLLKTTACALVSSALLLLPAAEAHGHLHNHGNNDNAAAARAHDAHYHHHGDKHRSFRVREVRFSPFTVHDSTELNRALAILEHESQQCNDVGRRRRGHRGHHGHHGHDDNNDGVASAAGKSKQGGLRGNSNNNDDKHGDHAHDHHTADDDEERCFGRIRLAKGKTYQLEREFIFADAFKLDLEGRPGAQVRAAPGQRHLTLDDEAVLNAHQVAFVDGGCDKEGFVGGSVLLVNRASLFARGVNWTNNHAWSGGAIFADDARRLNVFHGVFKDNSADRKGGAVAIREARRQRKHNKHGHDDNEGAAGGNNKNKANEAAQKRRREVEERRKKQQAARAANKKNGGNGNAAGAGANGNDNDKQGHGHKRQQRRVSRVKFIRVKFSQNSANKGGAIWNDGSHTEVEDSFFWKNQAHLGGAIFNAKHGRMLVRETAFVENEASAKGGAILNDGWLWVVCSAFVDNQAPLGCDIFNNGWLKCTSETMPVKIDGSGHGYCTPCTPPQTPAPTVKSTPMRRVKKAEVVNKHHHHDHHGDDATTKRGGLFGGLWNKNGNKNGDDKHEAAETRVFYDYYRHGEGNAYDRWNGYSSALVEEEEDEDFHSGYGYGAYGAAGWAGAGDKKKKDDGKGKGQGQSYGAASENYYADDADDAAEGDYGYAAKEDAYYYGAAEGDASYYSDAAGDAGYGYDDAYAGEQGYGGAADGYAY